MRALCAGPVLAALAIPAALLTIATVATAGWPLTRTLIATFAILLGVSTVLRAWCPVIVLAATRIFGTRLAALPLLSWWRFFAWCLMTAAFLAVVNKVPVFLPDWTLLIAVPFASLMVSAFLLRCVSCMHADPARYRAVLRRTLLRRTFLWIPVSLIPFLLLILVNRLLRAQSWWRSFMASDAGGVIGTVLVSAAVLALCILTLVLWAALFVQVIQSMQPGQAARTTSPVEEPAATIARERSPAFTWIAAGTAVLLLVVAVAGMNRMAVTHHYLRYTDARYQPAPGSKLLAFEKLHRALVDSACKGDLAFLRKLMGLDLRASPETLGHALECAVARSDVPVATFLIDNGASTLIAFRRAVGQRNLPMVRLLVAKGAAVDRYESYSKELGMAARSRDLVLMKILIDGGAVQDGYSDAGHVAIYEYWTASAPADDSAASWEKVVADGLAAGLEMKNAYKKADGVLHFAASRGYLGLIEVLLARGMDHRLANRDGVLPFMRLAESYPGWHLEPGPQFEQALLALTNGVDNINAPVTMTTPGGTVRHTGWTIARAAAAHRRVRAVLGERVDYAVIGQWPAMSQKAAEELMADLSETQLAGAPPLAPQRQR